MDLQTRVMEPSGHAGTVIAAGESGVYVQRDMDGQERFYSADALTKLATSDSAVRTRGTTVAPRAWTMGGRVD